MEFHSLKHISQGFKTPKPNNGLLSTPWISLEKNSKTGIIYGTTWVYAKICNQGKIVYTSFFPYTQLNMKQSYLMEARCSLPRQHVLW